MSKGYRRRGSLRVTLIALIVAMGLSVGPAPLQPAAGSSFMLHAGQPVAPGVEHRRGAAVAADRESSVHVVDIDPSDPDLRIESSFGLDRVNALETVSQQALRRSREGHRVVASVNGSTFNLWDNGTYSARGLNIKGGEVHTVGFPTASGHYATFAIDSGGRAMIGTPSVALTLTLPDGGMVPLARINQPRRENEAVLLTERYDSRTWTATDGVEAVIQGVDLPLRLGGTYSGTVALVQRGSTDIEIPTGSVVLSAAGAGAEPLADLQSGDPLTFSIAIDSGWESVVETVGAREQLVRRGAIEILPVGQKTYNTTAPRTSVGITASGRVLMVTVDGRLPGSPGLTIPQLAELMSDLGAVDAVNLDGGGSTTLAVRAPGTADAAVANRPSDGTERLIANALQVVSTAPTGPLAGVAIVPATAEMTVGQTRQFQLGGYDAAFNAVDPPGEPVEWAVHGSAASISSSGLLTATAVGAVTVMATAGPWSASAAVALVEDPGVLTVTAPQVSLVANVKTKKSSIPMLISWTAHNPRASITKIELQRRVDSGSWLRVVLADVPTTHQLKFAFGRRHELRVRVTDAAGNRSAWIRGAPFTLVALNAAGPGVLRIGSWTTLSSSKAIGGLYVRSRQPMAALDLVADAVQIAVIGQRGPKRGTAAMELDGAPAATIGLQSSSLEWRRVLYVSPAQPAEPRFVAQSTMRVRNASSGARRTVEINSFVLLLPAP